MSEQPQIRTTAGYLVYLLGPTIVAALCNEPDRLLVNDWPEDDGPIPGRAAVRRLEWALWALEHVRSVHGSDAAKTWFITENLTLGGHTPVRVVREGRYTALKAAVDVSLRPEGTKKPDPEGSGSTVN